MAERRRHRRSSVVVLCIALVLLALGFGLHYIYLDSYNSQERSLSQQSDQEAPDCFLQIYPRGGATDAWDKLVVVDGAEVNYHGVIYEVKLTNNTGYAISDWSARMDITQPCYLNNAWCGRLEIHQQRTDGEKVQTIDLREYDIEAITLEYQLEGQDLMIPLQPGDYIVYEPSEEAKEFPIAPSDAAMGDYRAVLAGLIFYTPPGTVMDFADVELNYRLHRNVVQDPVFWVLIVLLAVWVICVIVLVAVEINLKAARKRMRQDEAIIRQSMRVFTRFFDAKDKYTNGHSLRVADYSGKLAWKLGMSEDACRQVYYMALMHDCGKVCIPDEILKKPGKLTQEEFEVIKTHTTQGAEMLNDFSSIPGIREGALYHHERYDGGGYPTGKKGEEIPLIGRIICVADAFDAMNSQRCYRNRLTREHIISELENNRGKQFDPVVVDGILKLIEEGSITVGAPEDGPEH